MADTDKKASLLTPKFRVSFPSVFEKTAFEGSAPRYSVTGLFKPTEFTEAEKLKWQAIRKALDEACIEAFKKPLNECVKSIAGFKVCGVPTTLTPKGAAIWYRKGETKPDVDGYGPGIAFFVMSSSKRRPGVVDKSGVTITPENSEEFYAGCYARASVLPYTYDNKFGKGVSIGLGNLQKLGDGESFSGFSSAEEDFGGDAAEFDPADDAEDFADGAAADETDPTA
jgi:hypothetical protein